MTHRESTIVAAAAVDTIDPGANDCRAEATASSERPKVAPNLAQETRRVGSASLASSLFFVMLAVGFSPPSYLGLFRLIYPDNGDVAMSSLFVMFVAAIVLWRLFARVASGSRVAGPVFILAAASPWIVALAWAFAFLPDAGDPRVGELAQQNAYDMLRGAQSVASLVSGTLLAATSVGLAVAALEQRDPGRHPIGMLLSVTVWPFVVLTAWPVFAEIQAGGNALLRAILACVIVGLSGAAIGRGYSRQLAFSATICVLLAIVVGTTEARLDFLRELVGQLRLSSESMRLAMSEGAHEILVPASSCEMYGPLLALVPLAALGIRTWCRSRPSGRDVFGLLVSLTIAAALSSAHLYTRPSLAPPLPPAPPETAPSFTP